MNLVPFSWRRRATVKGELWGLPADLQVQPSRLKPGAAAGHDLTLTNKETMAYRIEARGKCGPLLRYGSRTEWSPTVVEDLKPDESVKLEGKLGLPSDCDVSQLPCSERITVNVKVDPANPYVFGQEEDLHCRLKLKP
jgi:hypothetical protein